MKSYLIKLPDGTQMGPFPWEKIDKLYASRRISGDDLVWTEGMPAWLPLREVQNRKTNRIHNRRLHQTLPDRGRRKRLIFFHRAEKAARDPIHSRK